MSIKGDVLQHLLEHEGEVVSLPALAAMLDIKLDSVRSAVSQLRHGAGRRSGNRMANIGDNLKIVSQGYAIMYVKPSLNGTTPHTSLESDSTSTPTETTETTDSTSADADATSTDATPTNATPESTVESTRAKPSIQTSAPMHPITTSPRKVLNQLGNVAAQVFGYMVKNPNRPITGEEVMKATGLKRNQVSGAFYNTLTNEKQRNRNAVRLFRKVGRDTYQYDKPITTASPAPKSTDPVVDKVVVKLYGDQETDVSRPSAPAGQKRLFEEVRTLPDGSILIEDENGQVYKAKEV